MNNKMIFSFIGGVLVGIGAGYLLTKNHFYKLMEERVNEAEKSIKDSLTNKLDEFEKIENERQETKKDISTKNAYSSLIREYSPEKTDYTKPITDTKEDKKIESDIKVVSEDEFGSDTDYDIRTLTYYTDKRLVNDDNEPYDDIVNIIGEDGCKLLKDIEAKKLDDFYVKNDKFHAYYEILRSELSFQEIIEDDPWLSHKYGIEEE